MTQCSGAWPQPRVPRWWTQRSQRGVHAPSRSASTGVRIRGQSRNGSGLLSSRAMRMQALGAWSCSPSTPGDPRRSRSIAWRSIGRISSSPRREGATLLNLEDCSPVFLAHELYHHLARSAPRPPFSRAYRVTLLQLGRWRWTSRIASLEEIAAGAFAQSLLGMKFHPRLIEPLWVRQEHGGEQ